MTTDGLSMTPSSTIRSDEVARFNRLAATCWNHRAWWTRNVSVNYISSFVKSAH